MTTQNINQTLDDAVEAIHVAAGLGMTVPAVAGMLVWVGQLHGPPTVSASGQRPFVITAPICISRESVETYLVNYAIREMVLLDENPSPWMPDGWSDWDIEPDMDDVVDRANEYVTSTTNEQILQDYEKYCRGTFVIWQEQIVAHPEPRGTVEHFYDRRLNLLPNISEGL